MTRIDYIASLVSGYDSLADVGADHAFISIEAVKNYNVGQAYALDINDGPLENARANIARNKLSSKIKTIKSDGLISFNEDASAIVIAGMGGGLISKILSDSLPKAKKAKLLVLEPNNEEAVLREFLLNNGFLITDEELIEDKNHLYEVISCKPGAMTLDKLDIIFGPILRKKKSELFVKKYTKKLNIFTSSLEKCSEANKEEIEKNISLIKEVL